MLRHEASMLDFDPSDSHYGKAINSLNRIDNLLEGKQGEITENDRDILENLQQDLENAKAYADEMITYTFGADEAAQLEKGLDDYDDLQSQIGQALADCEANLDLNDVGNAVDDIAGWI